MEPVAQSTLSPLPSASEWHPEPENPAQLLPYSWAFSTQFY